MNESDYDLLLQGYVEGSLDQARRSDLAAALAGDAELRRQFDQDVRNAVFIAARMAPCDRAGMVHAIVQLARRSRASARWAAVSSIRRAVVGSRRGPRRKRSWLGSPAFFVLAAAAATLAFVFGAVYVDHLLPARVSDLSQMASIVELHGTARIGAGAPGQPAQVGDRLAAGGTLHSDSEAMIRLRFPDRTELVLRGAVQLSVPMPGTEQGKRLRLDSGELSVDVAPQPASAPLVIATPRATATIVGTRFNLTTHPDASYLDVAHGTVRLTRQSDRQSVMVQAGQYAEADAGMQVMQVHDAGSLDAGLAAHWALDDATGTTVADASGNQNLGRLVKPQAWVAGKLGKALQFDGLGDRVDGGIAGMPAFEVPHTIAFWLRYPEIPTEPEVAVALSNRPNGVFIGFHRLSGTVVKLGVWNCDATAFSVGCEPPQAQRWHHLAHVFDGSVHRLYVDGLLVASSSVPAQRGQPTAIMLGGLTWNVPSSEHFRGELDDVRIYGRALSEVEVRRLSRAP